VGINLETQKVHKDMLKEYKAKIKYRRSFHLFFCSTNIPNRKVAIDVNNAEKVKWLK
jgi:hypothetical protein